ncbi:transposase [Streptomyces sp. E11-3]|uniref:transposase n=1 Tax=Streptomyces sp. E11-3 TaxID=3110112 RepID=UPI00397FBB8E
MLFPQPACRACEDRLACTGNTDGRARHAHGLRHCRYRGTAQTHVQHALTAAGANIIRLSRCGSPGSEAPTRARPVSRFRQLCRDSSV